MEMSIETTELWIRIACAIAGGAVFVMVTAVALTAAPGRMLLRTYEEVGQYLKKSRSSLWDYRKLQSYLTSRGAAYHFWRQIGPISYVLLRVVCGSLGMLLGSRAGLTAAIVLAGLGYFLPDVLLIYMNKKDNERLLPEIKLVYSAIAMQIRAGVYLTDALSECYVSVQPGRLREALCTLCSEIAMKSDLEDALERFRQKFQNQYIDGLCIAILQALESGQAVELLSDIAEQMKDMEVSLMNRKKSSLDRSITFYQLGILSAVLAVVIYACVVHMSAAIQF